MTYTIELTPEMRTRLEREAAKRGQEPGDVVAEALEHMLPSQEQEDARIEAGWDALTKLIVECQMDTGITDLAHQHDHYIHGSPKREPYPPEAGA